MKKFFCIALLLALCAPAANAQSALDGDIRGMLQPYIDNGDLPGVVTVVADRDEVLSLVSVGWRDVENKGKMDADALFWIASQSKPIAGCAVMMLVDEGKLDLDAPVTDYLPELSALMVQTVERKEWKLLEKPATPVTLRRLLSHTAGMAWVGGVQQQMGRIDVLSLNKSLYVSSMTPLLYQPGERYSYSNQGINIAATVIERVTGIRYEEFLQQRLFDPLGMKSATFWPESGKLAIPYRKDEDGRLKPVEVNQLQYPLSDRANRYAEAGGGLFCSPNDLVKFYRMIANKGVYNGKRYLSERAIEEMGSKQTGEDANWYGLGWGGTDAFMGHGGAYGTDSRVYKQSGIVTMYFIQGQGLPKHQQAIDAFLTIAGQHLELK